jgi:hypothetical protein
VTFAETEAISVQEPPVDFFITAKAVSSVLLSVHDKVPPAMLNPVGIAGGCALFTQIPKPSRVGYLNLYGDTFCICNAVAQI